MALAERLPVGVSAAGARRGLNIALVILVGWSAALLIWQWTPLLGAPLPPAPVASAVERSAEAARAPRLDAVAGLQLFGRAEAPKQVAAPPVQAPETRLNLTLRGVIAAGDPAASRAIIAAPGSAEAMYSVGAALPGGATLAEVRGDRVILSRGGRFETLHLPRDSQEGVVTSVAPRAARATAPATPASREVPERAVERLNEYRESILQNPAAALDLLEMRPVTENGTLRGYSIAPKRDRRLFTELGLRAGDVVIDINGIPLNDPAQMGQLFSQFSGAGQLTLTVERDGQLESIVVPLSP